MNLLSSRIARAAIVAAAAWAPIAANAQSSDAWKFDASIYGWLPTIGGKTTFPAGTGSSISVDGEQILDALKFTFMGTFEARKGRWGLFTDVIYLNVGGSKSKTRDVIVDGHPLPVGVTADAQLDIKSWVWTLAGTYRVVDVPSSTLDVFAGARLLDLQQTLGWEFSADLGNSNMTRRSGSSEIKVNYTDGIVGAKGRLSFGAENKWYVPYYADIGTGQSDLTYQLVGGVGYAFNWGRVFGVWRYLDYNFKSGSRIESANFNGPAIGVAFSW